MTKNKENKEMYKFYQQGYSLEDIGKMYNISRQSVFAGFKLRKYKLRTKKILPFQFFDNKKFCLINQGYYRLSCNDRILMHRYVWEYYNGKIPPKHDIHHINNDISDNRINNLELYTKSEHAKKFNKGNNQYVKRRGN